MKLNRNKVKERKLSIKSRTENLTLVREFISSVISEVCSSQDKVDDVVLAVDEAVTNVIKHAYKFSPDGDILIKVKCSNEKIEIQITDFGLPFSPNSIPVPDLKKYFKEKRVGGLGIFLMKSLMDDVNYKSVPNKFNQVNIIKKLNSN